MIYITQAQETRLKKAVVMSGPCFYCSEPSKHADHIVPWIGGGLSTPRNLIPACASCNCKKNRYMLDQDARAKAKMHAFIMEPTVIDLLDYLHAKDLAKLKSPAGLEMAKLIDFIYQPLVERGLIEKV